MRGDTKTNDRTSICFTRYAVGFVAVAMNMAGSTEAEHVPVINIAQNKKILAKKKKVLRNRNLLVKPYDVYWPVLDEKENARFTSAFEKIIEARSEFDTKKEDAKESTKLKRQFLSTNISFAINDVSRSVTKGTVIAVLLAEDVDPTFLVQHLAILCGTRDIPVLVVSSLRKYTEKILGFSSIAIGLKKCVTETKSNCFNEIHQLILEVAKSHKPPASIRQFNVPPVDAKLHSETESSKSVTKISTPKVTQTTPASDVYLYRTSRGSRVFVPKPLYPPKIEMKEKVELGDFLSLGDDSDFDDLMGKAAPVKGISYTMQNLERNKKRRPSPPAYVPLKHIKVKPNPGKKTRRNKTAE